MYDDYDTDYSQLDYSDDYTSKSKQKVMIMIVKRKRRNCKKKF